MQVRRAGDVVHDVVGGRAVLIDGDGREVITLNPTGTLVWQALDGERELEEIARAIHDEVQGATLDQVEADVRAFVTQLLDEGLVEPV